MKLITKNALYGLLLLGALCPGAALACDPALNGCLGCTDEELPACMDKFVVEICNAGGGMNACDRRRVFDDVERQVLTSMGHHMARVRSLVRSARKYQRP
ncbi:MAG: hypothetical protein OEU44_04065 [Gammaproteobacteria bacterium]|nr:hypothetical protein [Gammaproteobacteria bacterium]